MSLRLVLMSALSFVAMYALMYMMVDALGNVFHSVNQVYMAGMMTAAMVIIELVVMAPMYRPRSVALPVVVIAVLALVGCIWMTRRQVAVGDEQFVRSMIPHHAGAILMCNESKFRDPSLRDLCGNIVRVSSRKSIS